jgi:ABC-2 type transport system permease protein
MTGYRELLARELLEAWRTYRLGVLALVFLGLGIAAPALTKLLPDLIKTFTPQGFQVEIPELGVADVVDQFLKNVVQFGALGAILLTMGSVATEKERGTAAFVLAKPVTRLSFLAAKVASIALQFGIAIALAAIGAWIYTSLLFQTPPVLAWAEMAVIVWLSTMVYVAITFLGSVVMRSSLGAAAFGFGGLIALSLLSIVPQLAIWLPAGLTAVGASTAMEEASPDLDPFLTIGMSIVVVVVALVASWIAFRRQEL